MSTGVPPIQSALLPEDVRKAGPKAERLYETALSFEGVLVDQLTQSLGSTLDSAGSSDGSDGSDDGEDTTDAASSLTAQMIPDALSQSITASGGLGLAHQLYEALGGSKLAGSADTAPATTEDGGAT
jgi:Rod binding domain-containing protein